MLVAWAAAWSTGLGACGGEVGSLGPLPPVAEAPGEGGAASTEADVGPEREKAPGITMSVAALEEQCEPTMEMESYATTLYPGPCRVEQDEGFDAVVDSIFVHTYDDEGRLVSTASENPQTGQAFQDTSSYDPEGQLVVHQAGPEDGQVTWTDLYEYDDEGRLARTVTGPIGPGQEPLWTDYIYSDEGVLLRLEQTRRPDGVLESRVLFTYDPSGRHRLRDNYQKADGDRWVTWRILEHSYDDAWREVQTTEDRQGADGSPPDGVPDWSNRNFYDEHGNILVSAVDRDGDGVTDTCTVRDYTCW
jgi:hypothetical protein